MPPLTSSSATSVVVVVLPWVPATAMLDLSRMSSASISARRTTGRPCRRASSSSALPGLMADEITTTSAPSRFPARCPMKNPRAHALEPLGDRRRFQVAALHLVAVIDAAPRRCPTCRCRRCRRNGSGRHRWAAWWLRSSVLPFACQFLDHVGQPLRRIRHAPARAPPAPSCAAPCASLQNGGDLRARLARSSLLSGMRIAPPASTSPRALAVWWSAAAAA